ncbi:putative nuclease of restriction endonuclease-like (RecB) superfamily [Lacibacter cauensis]|uniref:Putative nuclease of restriction endonuclease-like (RecB) superfamily n=1 Tax=Lacibacter cauensis TaxID=510947 RepID=A0A562S958_9BACT|nr:PDDEXK nuclease domain-containing protein [Lacibacter cauensis]TWI77937.1 putative nuclease of restriction endonuclease-like (RecB) superfamily [Lacibacter cauensis]
MSKLIPHNALINSIKKLIDEARKQVVRNVNTTMLVTNFEIGRMIVEYEQKGRQRAEYAKETLKTISQYLTAEFGKGYSVDNLENCRKFYLAYKISDTVSRKSTQPKSGTPSRISEKTSGTSPYETLSRNSKLSFELTWSHYVQLLKIADEQERSFYQIEAIENNWSVREFARQYSAGIYERLAFSRDKKGIKQLAKKGQVIEKPIDALKSHYVLEFLNLKEDNRYSETELETAIIDKLEHFMLELGKGFLFEGRQRRFTFEGDSFFVDLVFYNRLLKCFVIIDLKIGKLTHQDIGQMQMYVNYYDRMMKTDDENPTIGIILCREENKTVVEFTLPKTNNQIFTKEYKHYLPSKAELQKQLQ